MDDYLKAFKCENCCTRRCPNKDETSIVKAALSSMLPGKTDFVLSPLDINQLHKYCGECPEYNEMRLN